MEEENSLAHYGVIGMKWGVRNNKSRAFSKAVSKADKLSKRVEKTELNALKKRSKYDKKLVKTLKKNPDKASKMYKKISKAERKVYNAKKASGKWEKQMVKNLANIKLSEVNDEVLNTGRRYVYMLTDDRPKTNKQQD